MRLPRVTYIEGAELPSLELWWFNNAGALIDFTAGWTWLVEVGRINRAALVSKASGIVGAAGSGDACDPGTPNVTINWAANELDVLDPGNWVIEVTATNASSLARKAQIELVMLAEVEALVP